MKRKKLLAVALALVIAGIVLLAVTLYERPLPPPEEMPHMELSPIRHELLSQNIDLTLTGVLFIAFGVFTAIVAVSKR